MTKRGLSYLYLALFATVWIALLFRSPNTSQVVPSRFEKAAIIAAANGSSCFNEALQNTMYQKSNVPSDEATFDFSLPTNPLVHDAYEYSYSVSYPSRTAQVVRTGGIAGTYESLGTVHLGPCIREAMLSYQGLGLTPNSSSSGIHE